MTRLAKAMSAFSFGRGAQSAGRDARSLAPRDALPCSDGSGAPSAAPRPRDLHYRLSLAVAGLFVAALFALAATLPSSASAADYTQGTTFCSATGSAAGECQALRGVAVDQSNGHVYVVDSGNARIDEFAPDGTFVKAFGVGVADGTTVPQFCTTTCLAGKTSGSVGALGTVVAGIAVDPVTHIVYFVAGANKVAFYNGTTGEFLGEFNGQNPGATGQVATIPAAPQAFSGNKGLALDTSGAQHFLYVATANLFVYKFKVPVVDGSGTVTTPPAFECQITGREEAEAELCSGAAPSKNGAFNGFNFSGEIASLTAGNLAVDEATGNLYVAETNSTQRNNVSKFDSSGAFVSQFTPTVSRPAAVAASAAGNVFAVVGGANDFVGGVQVQEYDPSSPAAPLSDFGLGTLSDSRGVALDSSGLAHDGTVYAADFAEKRVFSFVTGGAATEYELTRIADGDGAGEIACKVEGGEVEPCEDEYPEGTGLELVAQPDANSDFAEWSGDCSGTDPCLLTMDGPKSVTAVFDLKQRTLTRATDGGDGSGQIECKVEGGPQEACEATYQHGTEVELIPVNDGGSAFAFWTGDCTGSGACELTMDADRSVTAAFSLAGSFSLTATALGEGEIQCDGGDCEASYPEDTVVELSAHPGPHSLFDGWSVTGSGTVTTPCAGTTSPCEVKLDDHVNASASFETVAITDLEPDKGPEGGANEVEITGTNLTGVTEVDFGPNPATGFTIDNDTTITATAPAGTGTVDVAVSVGAVVSADTAADNYTYVAAPTITGLDPTEGPTAGGTEVTISGENLEGASGAAAVKFGAANATSYTVDSDTQITAVAPAAAAGTVRVSVTTAGGTTADTAADDYAYVAPPAVSALTPNKGPLAGGNEVTIAGTNLSDVTEVKFGSNPATGLVEDSPTQIRVNAPAGTGVVDVIVTTAVGGPSANTAADNYTYVAAPTVSSLSPNKGPAAGANNVVIVGTNLADATKVDFGSTEILAAQFVGNGATFVTVAAPPGAPGTVDIAVTTAGGTSADTAADDYTYVAAPTITGLDPTEGPTTGGTSVKITGENLEGASGAAAVKFGAANATSYTVDSDTQITAVAPPAAAGTVRVSVTTPGGTTADTAADDFTYVLRTLTVTKHGTGTGTVTSSPTGINCGPVSCAANYTHGTTVLLTAVPGPMSGPVAWQGCDKLNGPNHCEVKMEAAREVHASFEIEQFNLVVSILGGGSGGVFSSPAGVNCGAACTASFTHSTVVSLVATPAPGSVFSGWTGACTGTGACEVTLEKAAAVGAIFELIALPDPIAPIVIVAPDPKPNNKAAANTRKRCVIRANNVRKRAVKAAKARKGKARGRAIRSANKRRATAVKRCNRAFRRAQRG